MLGCWLQVWAHTVLIGTAGPPLGRAGSGGESEQSKECSAAPNVRARISWFAGLPLQWTGPGMGVALTGLAVSHEVLVAGIWGVRADVCYAGRTGSWG